jgi:hypothetical protein
MEGASLAGALKEFTPAEANALLPTLRPLLAQLREAFHSFSFAREQAQDAERSGEVEEATRWRAEAEALAPAVQVLVDKLDAMGVEVKDPLLGLIDLRGRRADGTVVYLCYRDGEDAVRFWHELAAGFGGRRPMKEL